LLRAHLPLEWIIAAVPLLSLLAAQAMFRLVEAPSIRLGRRLADRAGARHVSAFSIAPPSRRHEAPLAALSADDLP